MKYIVILFVALLSLVGCKTKYVAVPEYHKEYITRTDTFVKLDSVYAKDSVFMYHNGDTIFVNKVAYRDRYHNIYKVKLDTIIKSDSIPCPVERQLTKNEQRLMSLGKCFIGFLFSLVVAIAASIWWYHNKKC